jgi:hypothetical protein
MVKPASSVVFSQSIFLNTKDPSPTTGSRKYLDEGTKHCSQPFGRAVAFVNRNQASWGDKSLPMQKAYKYVEDAKKVENGIMNNAGAFANSATAWAQMGNLVGVLMNTAGAFIAGAIDHKNRATGALLTMQSS